MNMIKLGQTNIEVNKNGFGALPIQRASKETAVKILTKAYENGITFFDTARFYTDSEEKIGLAFSKIRDKIFIASKTMAQNADDLNKDLEKSLSLLKTDYLDLYQFHNPSFCPIPNDNTGLYEAMLKAKKDGKIKHIGITNHRLNIAKEAINSGLYETLQFPFSYLSSKEDEELVFLCEKHNMGFIAMKALAGGLITNSKAAYAYMNKYTNVLPIWGIQKETELDEFLIYDKNIPAMDEEIIDFITKERTLLSKDFCRGCGYCMPCPAGIEINNCARMSLLLRRSPTELQLTKAVQEKMNKIQDCMHCNKCKNKCPYGLDTPTLLAENFKDYFEVLNGKKI